jgi:lambda family phage portal protein
MKKKTRTAKRKLATKNKRSYDAAATFKTDDWVSATAGGANSEIKNAQAPLRNKGRDVVRNNAYANRALNAIVNNTVGSGISPNIRSKSKLQTKKIKEAWKQWGETSLCDAFGRNNFYGLQALALRSVVESGEVLALKEIRTDGMKLRLLECDYLVPSVDSVGIHKDSGEQVYQGIKVDKFGQPISYFTYDSHPGEANSTANYTERPADKLLHVYRQDRPGQLRGVSWFHPVLRVIEDFNEYQMATIIGRKSAASIFAVITGNGQDSNLTPTKLREKRQRMMELGPATAMFIENGENVTLQAPPAVSGYDEFSRTTLRTFSSGIGLPYSALTGDYSQYNFSSSKMEHGEFRKNVEAWRWNMFIPQFCEPAFQLFLDWCRIAKGINTDGVTCEWVPPAWAMIDPTKEIPAMVDALRGGLTSRPKAILELGYDPDQLDEEIAESNKRLDELEITLDSDPRKMTKQGMLQMSQSQGNQNNVQDNQKTAADGVPSNSNSDQSNS